MDALPPKTLVERLRDPLLMLRWWDHYGLEAADEIERLTREIMDTRAQLRLLASARDYVADMLDVTREARHRLQKACDEADDLLCCAEPSRRMESATPEDWEDQVDAWRARNGYDEEAQRCAVCDHTKALHDQADTASHPFTPIPLGGALGSARVEVSPRDAPAPQAQEENQVRVTSELADASRAASAQSGASLGDIPTYTLSDVKEWTEAANNGRCYVCGWRFASPYADGCRLFDCSFRPTDAYTGYTSWRRRLQKQEAIRKALVGAAVHEEIA